MIDKPSLKTMRPYTAFNLVSITFCSNYPYKSKMLLIYCYYTNNTTLQQSTQHVRQRIFDTIREHTIVGAPIPIHTCDNIEDKNILI